METILLSRSSGGNANRNQGLNSLIAVRERVQRFSF